MKTIKIIDLLNMIANGEEVPKKIKINSKILVFNGYTYLNEKSHQHNIFYYINMSMLNNEVEIIEEQPADVGKEFKKIEKISLLTEPIGRGYIEPPSCCDLMLESKLNEVIEVLNEMRENK